MKILRILAWLLLATPLLAIAATTDISREELVVQMSAADASARPLVVDVRSAEEFAAGHIPGAINIPHDQADARAEELRARAKDADIVLYCRSGRRAGLAAEVLEKRGFTRLKHLTGDYTGWTGAGQAIEK